jgi:signal transduction histidine kinase
VKEVTTLLKTLRILVADDDDGDRKYILRTLTHAGLAFEGTESGSVNEALQACDRFPFDCAIVDYRLPGQDGLAGITALHERLPYMAIIMVTGHGDELVATEAMKRGASDYIPKTSISEQSIKRSIENSMEKVTLLRTIAQQREELEGFSRMLVHDLKAPMHTILGFAALIEESIQAGSLENIAPYCLPIVKGIERMDALIETLYLYTRAGEKVAFRPIEMRQVMIDTVANLEHLIRQRGARVTCGELPTVCGTPQLTQLLQNLIGNGIKYCKAEVSSVHVAATLQEGNVWLFSVKDNGIGIPANHYQDVFKQFHRLHGEAEYEGTGLGLATCKKIVERHGGTIYCESREGQGTTFFFTLRAA